jgi:hypothetical protein
MSESMPHNEARKPVKDLIKDETRLAVKKQLPDKSQMTPADESDWREACAYIGNDILSEKEYKDAGSYIFRNWNDVKRQHVAGGKCCLAIFPVSDMGLKWTANEIKDKAYLRLLNISKTDGLTRNFSFYAARYFELLPELMQKDVSKGGCSFDIPPEEPGSFGKDTAEFIKNYLLAFNNLRKFFGLPPIEVKRP